MRADLSGPSIHSFSPVAPSEFVGSTEEFADSSGFDEVVMLVNEDIADDLESVGISGSSEQFERLRKRLASKAAKAVDKGIVSNKAIKRKSGATASHKPSHPASEIGDGFPIIP